MDESSNRQRAAADGDLASLANDESLFAGNAREKLELLRAELALLAEQYDAVVANPPYMGAKNMNRWLGAWVKRSYMDVKGDLFSCFMARNVALGNKHAQLGFMTPYVWMFIGTYEKLRRFVIEQCAITSLIQLEYSGFASATVPICTFTLQKGRQDAYEGGYIRLSDFPGAENQAPRASKYPMPMYGSLTNVSPTATQPLRRMWIRIASPHCEQSKRSVYAVSFRGTV